VNLPPHWDSRRANPLYVQLHGRGPDYPLGYVSSTFQRRKENEAKNADAIAIVPWLRGNGEWRNENGSEPDIWEAIEDVKSFAAVDPDRRYLSGHSWGATMHGRLPNVPPIYGRLSESWRVTRLGLHIA
jgi:hypothetical protein